MSHRFQIQDIVAQNRFGVTFSALDVETGEAVAVRRFFPFGADGGGLFEDEIAEYDGAVALLAGLKHPGLRAVLTGGCDPVDGMPFVVTEWITGQALADKLEHGVFSPSAAVKVLDRALEISEALSQVLGEEALWVETDPVLVIDDAGENRRGLTFSICPVKWVGGEISRRSLLPMAELAEELLGWRGLRVPDQAGNGLGSWVKWLRANPETVSLRQARERLALFAGAEAPQAAGAMAGPPLWPVRLETPEIHGLPPAGMPGLAPRRRKKSKSREPVVLIALLVVLLGSAAWWVTRESAARRARTAHAPAAAAPATVLPAAQGGAPAATDVPLPDGVFRSSETERIMEEKGREVTVEGVLNNIRVSDSGKTLYLEFVETTPGDEVRGCFMTKNLPADMSEEALKTLMGKRIRITGVVRIMHHFKAKWPEVLLTGRKSIQEVD